MKSFLYQVIKIKPEEIKGALLAFLFIFMLMASYMILRPVRDALPSEWGDVSRATQWTYTFIVSLIGVSVYNIVASRVPIRILVPSVFVFFALTFLGIYYAYKINLAFDFNVFGWFNISFESSSLGKVFYVWSSVFSLFHISVFWSFISHHYTKQQSKRVFSFINTGASAGGIAGPTLLVLVQGMNVENILLITSSVLLLTLPIISALNRHFDKHSDVQDPPKKLNPNPFSGFNEFITHKKLLGIAAFIFFFTGINAFFYTTQSDLLASFDSEKRTEILGYFELAQNITTILVGIFITNRLSRRFGLATSLSIVPLLIAIFLMFISLNPAIMLVLALQVVRRAGNYAITKPSREILYTAVDREARFKTKPIIDVAVYRGGDVFWIWSIAFLGDGYLNLGLTAKIFGGAIVCVLCGLVGVYLGKKHDAAEKLETDPESDEQVPSQS